MKSSRLIPEIFPSTFLDKDFDLKTLREDIKKRYLFYNNLDADRFPVFDYNTNRKNYESLKDAFEEEFFVRRGISRTKNNLHIPSTNTLALFFTDNDYTPSQKIFNTCRSFTKESIIKGESETFFEGEIRNTESPTEPLKRQFIGVKSLSILGVIFILGCIFYQLFIHKHEKLKIKSPSTNTVVPRIVAIDGSAENAREVWIVVMSKITGKCYVQHPIDVKNGKDWTGRIIIGSVSSEDVGQVFAIRAFVNPVEKLKTGDELKAWPEAEISTQTIEVIRGSKLTEE